MFVGDVMRREPKYKSQSCFRCYSGPNFGGDDQAPCADSRLDFENGYTLYFTGSIAATAYPPRSWRGSGSRCRA